MKTIRENNIKRLRIQSALTPAECARKIGVTRACWYNWENGARQPITKYYRPLMKLFKIESVYDVLPALLEVSGLQETELV